MTSFVNDIGEGAANLVGAGPSGGPLGGFKPYAQGVDDLAAVALAPETGGLSLAVPGAFAAEDVAKGNYLGAAGNVAALAGGAYSAGVGPFAPAADAAGGAGAGAAGAAAPLGSAGGPATLGGDLSAGAPALADTGTTSPGIAALGGAPGVGSGVAGAAGGSPVATSPGILSTIGNDIGTAGTNVGNFLSNNLPSWLGGTPTAGSTFGTVGEAAPGAGTVGALASPDNFGVINNVTGTVAGAGAPALSAGGGGGGSSAGLFGDIGSFGNKLTQPGALLGIAGLGYEALKGTPTVPNLNNLTTEAASAFNTEQQLISPELTGQLPPGAAAGVAQGLESAKAQIRAQFANDGLTGSSAEADALASADQAAASQSFQIAASMANQGLNLAGLSSQIYEQIIQQTLGSDTAFNQALVNFGTAAAGGGARIQIGGTNG